MRVCVPSTLVCLICGALCFGRATGGTLRTEGGAVCMYLRFVRCHGPPRVDSPSVRQEPGRKFAWSVVVVRDGALVAAR